jgi:hypothetical protein
MAFDQEIESLAPELSRRLDAILSGIQGEADKMLEQARAEPSRQVVVDTNRQADELISKRRRRLAQLSDDLIARSEQVLVGLEETARLRDSFARLFSALSDAADRIAEEARATAVLPRTPPPPPPPAPAPPAELQAHAPLFASTTPMPEPVSPAPPAPPPSSTAMNSAATAVDRSWVEARQATIHMAAAGNTRAQVETQLRDFLGVADPGSLLDQVFGAASGADSRVPWAIAPATPLHPRR